MVCTAAQEVVCIPAVARLILPVAKSPRCLVRLRNGASVVAVSMRIGTRKSIMSPAQTEHIARRLSAAAPERDVEIVKFETVGNTDQTCKLLKRGSMGAVRA
jgi:Porphobilinogen deaminase, dipyromethane cofactor binding domain